ncbi:MAG: patatin-like phospholipase family protein [Leptospirillia bacterium]
MADRSRNPDKSDLSKRPTGALRDADSHDRVALVLAGGGIPGWMYEIGVLTALDEFFKDGFSTNHFDMYVGTSAGAALASLLANGVSPREIYDAIIADDPDSLYNFSRPKIYGFGTGETWPMIRKVLAASGRMVAEVVEAIVKRDRKMSMLDLAYTVQESLPSGIFTLKPLEKTLRQAFDAAPMTNDFRDLKVDLFIPAVDLDKGEYVVFGDSGWDDVPISRAVIASSAVPVLFQPVRINDADYIDGGIGRVANMRVAVDQGAGLVLVVNPVVHLNNDRNQVCLPTCYGFCRGLRDKGMSFVADQAMRVNTGMRLRNAKAQQEALYPDVDIEIIEPDPSDTVMFTQNVVAHDTRHEVMRYGYRSTVAALLGQFERYQTIFGRRGIGVTLDHFRWRPRSSGMHVLGPNERERTGNGLPLSEAG